MSAHRFWAIKHFELYNHFWLIKHSSSSKQPQINVTLLATALNTQDPRHEDGPAQVRHTCFSLWPLMGRTTFGTNKAALTLHVGKQEVKLRERGTANGADSLNGVSNHYLLIWIVSSAAGSLQPTVITPSWPSVIATRHHPLLALSSEGGSNRSCVL